MVLKSTLLGILLLLGHAWLSAQTIVRGFGPEERPYQYRLLNAAGICTYEKECFSPIDTQVMVHRLDSNGRIDLSLKFYQFGDAWSLEELRYFPDRHETWKLVSSDPIRAKQHLPSGHTLDEFPDSPTAFMDLEEVQALLKMPRYCYTRAQLNAAGDTSSIVRLSPLGVPSSTEKYSYDAQGNCVLIQRVVGDSSRLVHQIVQAYDMAGNRKKVIELKANEGALDTVLIGDYKFSDQRLTESLNRYGRSDNVRASRILLAYDGQGRLIKETLYRLPKVEPYSERQYSYDAQGRLIGSQNLRMESAVMQMVDQRKWTYE